jgi:hypothetical protein
MDERDSIKKIVASKGKVLRRISDGFIAGPDLYLGYTYYLHGEKLDEPLLELPEHYEEIDIPEELNDNDINTD